MLTCTSKNIFRLLADKGKYSVYHPLGIDRVIAGLTEVVRCNLNVVDTQEKVIVCLDPLPLDILVCRFVSLDPLRLKHLGLISWDRNLKLNEVMNQVQIIKM